MDAVLTQRVLLALSQPSRLRIYQELLRAEQGLTRLDILRITSQSKGAVTIHLRTLHEAELISLDVEGRTLGDFVRGIRGDFHCRANKTTLHDAFRFIEDGVSMASVCSKAS